MYSFTLANDPKPDTHHRAKVLICLNYLNFVKLVIFVNSSNYIIFFYCSIGDREGGVEQVAAPGLPQPAAFADRKLLAEPADRQ